MASEGDTEIGVAGGKAVDEPGECDGESGDHGGGVGSGGSFDTDDAVAGEGGPENGPDDGAGPGVPDADNALEPGSDEASDGEGDGGADAGAGDGVGGGFDAGEDVSAEAGPADEGVAGAGAQDRARHADEEEPFEAGGEELFGEGREEEEGGFGGLLKLGDGVEGGGDAEEVEDDPADDAEENPAFAGLGGGGAGDTLVEGGVNECPGTEDEEGEDGEDVLAAGEGLLFGGEGGDEGGERFLGEGGSGGDGEAEEHEDEGEDGDADIGKEAALDDEGAADAGGGKDTEQEGETGEGFEEGTDHEDVGGGDSEEEQEAAGNEGGAGAEPLFEAVGDGEGISFADAGGEDEGIKDAEGVIGDANEKPGASSEECGGFSDAEDAAVPGADEGGDEGGEGEGAASGEEAKGVLFRADAEAEGDDGEEERGDDADIEGGEIQHLREGRPEIGVVGVGDGDGEDAPFCEGRGEAGGGGFVAEAIEGEGVEGEVVEGPAEFGAVETGAGGDGEKGDFGAEGEIEGEGASGGDELGEPGAEEEADGDGRAGGGADVAEEVGEFVTFECGEEEPFKAANGDIVDELFAVGEIGVGVEDDVEVGVVGVEGCGVEVADDGGFETETDETVGGTICGEEIGVP